MPFWIVPLLAAIGLSSMANDSPPPVVDTSLPADSAGVVARMERAAQRLYPDDRLPWTGNEQGRLGWTEAYTLRAFVRAAQVTGDRRWLQKATTHVDQVLKRTDRARGLRDYRGDSRLSWSSIDRSADGERIVWLVDTAHLSEALLEVAEAIDAQRMDPTWSAHVREAVATALTEFEPAWRTNPDGTGFYVYLADEPHRAGRGRHVPTERGLRLDDVPLPWNQQLLAAKAWWRLSRANGEGGRERAAAILQAWHQAVTYDADGGWTWTYWGAPVSQVYPNPEPVHYAGIALGFIGDLVAAHDPWMDPSWEMAARATAQRVIRGDRLAVDLQATRWVPVGSTSRTDAGLLVGIAEWGRWYGSDCARWRTAMQALWEVGESPSSWLGWMELLAAGWCAPPESAPVPVPDPFKN